MIILAIESAISGGSISLLRDGAEIANWVGSSSVSKAEELLVNIDEILSSTGVQKNDIGLVAVSAGPGSFTGIRIGIATALGLKNGLGIAMASESALKAMAFLHTGNDIITAAIPMGRDAVCCQTFQRKDGKLVEISEPQTMREDAFLTEAQSDKDKISIIHSALYQKIKPHPSIRDFGSNTAYAIGLMCRANPGVISGPLFVSKNF